MTTAGSRQNQSLSLSDVGIFIAAAQFTTLPAQQVRSGRENSLAQKFIIDADPGIDDALAILTAMGDPSVELLAVTASAGIVSGLQATRNLQFLIELMNPVRYPRIGQCTRPALINDAMPEIAELCRSLNGHDGLGQTNVEIADLHNRRESARLIVDIVREFPGEVRLLTLGPLSNLFIAADRDPQLSEHLHSVVSLGGSLQAAGDVTATAEFNIWANPQAARTVCTLPVHKTLVPLEISGAPVLSFDDVDTLCGFLKSTQAGAFVSSVLQFAVRSHRRHEAQEGIPLRGVSALAVAASAEAFQAESAHIDVETTGELTQGMTVVDQRHRRSGHSNFDVVSSIDDAGVVDYFTRAIRRICQ